MRWPHPTPCPTQAHHKNGIGTGLSRPYPHMYPLGRLALSCSTVSLTSDHPGLNRSPQTPVGGGGLTLTPHPRQFFFPWADSMANLFLRRFAAEGFFFFARLRWNPPGKYKSGVLWGRVEGGGWGLWGCGVYAGASLYASHPPPAAFLSSPATPCPSPWPLQTTAGRAGRATTHPHGAWAAPPCRPRAVSIPRSAPGGNLSDRAVTPYPGSIKGGG